MEDTEARSEKVIGTILIANEHKFGSGLCELCAQLVKSGEINKKESKLVINKIQKEVWEYISFSFAWPKGNWELREEWIRQSLIGE